jgi:hypothetical protein
MGTPGYEPEAAKKPVPAGCGCICHTPTPDGTPAALHIMACCHPCRTCGKLVANETRETHERDCASVRGSP